MNSWLCRPFSHATPHSGDAFDTLLVWFDGDPLVDTRWRDSPVLDWVRTWAVEQVEGKWLAVLRCKEGFCVLPNFMVESDCFSKLFPEQRTMLNVYFFDRHVRQRINLHYRGIGHGFTVFPLPVAFPRKKINDLAEIKDGDNVRIDLEWVGSLMIKINNIMHIDPGVTGTELRRLYPHGLPFRLSNYAEHVVVEVKETPADNVAMALVDLPLTVQCLVVHHLKKQTKDKVYWLKKSPTT